MDYNRYDEATLRNMLEASNDLDERRQLRSVLRRIKKHLNTVCFSPNRENIMNNNRNSAFAAKWDELGFHSSPSSPCTRHNGTIEKNCIGKYNMVKENNNDELILNQRGRQMDRGTLHTINGCSRNKEAALANGSIMSCLTDPLHPAQNLKQTLGKTFSEPMASNDLKLAHSRLIIQQMLAPRLAAAARQEGQEMPRIQVSKAEENRSSAQTLEMKIQTDVKNKEPVFTQTLCDVCVEDGETAVLECNVVAQLQPMVLWYRNSEPVPLDGRRYLQTYNGDLARLTVYNVGYDVGGFYECSARNAYGKVTSRCLLSLKGDQLRLYSTPEVPAAVTVRRSETLPSSALGLRVANSAARRAQGRMEAVKSSSKEEPSMNSNGCASAVAKPPEEVEEEAVARSTRTETASDGGKVTTTSTVTTHKTKDGTHLVTKQTKQITRVGGVGTTNYAINRCSAEEIAERLSGIFEKKALSGTSGVILVKTENWNSQDGITHRNEKSQIWEGPRLALSFNEADVASKLNNSEDDVGLTPLQRSATTVKQRLLEWCRITLKDYKHVNITNFSTSWNDGMAFCALIHHFIPDAFDYSQLDPKNRRENFQLAFETAERRVGIVPLLDVEDMVGMTVPDWKCVFMYVQSVYREFVLPKQEKQNPENAMKPEN